MKKLFVPGVFDVFHIGHLNYIKNASKHGDYIIVGIQDDRSVATCKNIKPVIPLQERVAIIQELKCVDEVVSYRDVYQAPLLEGLEIDVFACGDEYGQSDTYPDQKRTLKFCEDNDIEVVHISRTNHVSSTQIRDELKNFWQSRAKLQSKLSAGVTTLGSFAGNQEKVAEETRHEVELIMQNVSEPASSTLLDLGCGDGRQLSHLARNFKSVTGVDYSGDLLELAKPKMPSDKEVTLVEGDVSAFLNDSTFDVILLSGIIPCLDDDQMSRMMQNVKKMSHSTTRVLVRSSIALGERINVVNQFSNELKARYTAFYRTPAEISEHFSTIGFASKGQEQLYQHREDSAVWWFVFDHAPEATSHQSKTPQPHFHHASVPLAEIFPD